MGCCYHPPPLVIETMVMYIAYLRYSEASCESLVPTPTEENYAAFNLGGEVESINADSDDSAFDSPKELTARNPPYDIELDFARYRPGKEYKGMSIC